MAIETRDGNLKLVCCLGVRNGGRLLAVQYKRPSPPDRSGWWIPFAELRYGVDPYEVAEAELERLGFDDARLKIMDVESLIIGAASWHVCMHFVADVTVDPEPRGHLQQWAWFSADGLADKFVHKRWEAELARRMLAFGRPASRTATTIRRDCPAVAGQVPE